MAKTLHPKYRPIKVIFTDESEAIIYLAYKSDILRVDIDTKTHPAWSKGENRHNRTITGNPRVAKWEAIDFGALNSKKSQ